MRDIICSNWKLSCEQMKAQDEGGLTPTIFWTSTEFGGEMRHAGERERRTSFSDVLRSHRAGTARSPKGHCGDAGGPIGSQTTLYASESSSGECAILSARTETQPVSNRSYLKPIRFDGGEPSPFTYAMRPVLEL